MSRPGTQILSRDTPPPRSAPTETGVWFVAGLTDRGPVGPVLVQSLNDFINRFGQRQTYSVLYDAVETYFREGGGKVYVSRVFGPAPVLATLTLNDATGPALRVDAESAGTWGNNLHVSVVAGGDAGTFIINVYDHSSGVDVLLESSGELADQAAAVAWGAQSSNINITQLANPGDPVPVASTALAGGTSDRTNATDATWKAALDLFTRDLGPGQVSYPGRATTQAGTDLLAHAAANNRIAIIDGPDATALATLTASAAALRTTPNARYGGLFAPWVQVPGILPGTTRDVPPSAVVAGLMARSDVANSPNVPAAGVNGQSQFVLSVNATFSDADRETANAAGVNMIRMIYGGARLYGYRSLVDPLTNNTWLSLANGRLYMAIAAKGDEISERFVLSQIDGRRRKISQYGGELTAMLLPYWDEGSLYGDTPEEAFNVDVGAQVNTDQTIANQELHAVISMRMSPFAELVVLELVKVAITEGVA